jgi:hypothetical protein
LRVIVVENRSVAGNKSHRFISFECQCPIAIKLQFVDPIADRQLADWERIHWLDKRKVRRSVLLHPGSNTQGTT